MTDQFQMHRPPPVRMNVSRPSLSHHSSISRREWVINEGLKRLQQPQMDRQWLKTWIERKQKSASASVSLSDYRQRLVRHARLLQNYHQALQQPDLADRAQLKSQIEESNRAIYEAQLVKHIQEEIRSRKAKRARLRRRKEKKCSDPPAPIIDEHPSPPSGKTFAEKIQDIEKILKTVQRLKRSKSRHRTEQSSAELAEIESICRSKIQEYQTAMAAEAPSPEMELLTYLFNNQGHSFYESTHPDAQHFLRAHQNRMNLIQIRQDWDQYCTDRRATPDDALPSQWHEPQSPCDSNWSRYIGHRDTELVVNKSGIE